MAKYTDTHDHRLRTAGLKWLRAEDRHQRRRYGRESVLRLLDNGLHGTFWANDLGSYPLRAVMALQQSKEGRLYALQAAGKTAAVGRALYARLIHCFNPAELTVDDAHAVSFMDLNGAFPGTTSGFEYTPQSPQHPQLAAAIDTLHYALPRPVESENLSDQNLEQARNVCLAASQVFMDYLVMLCPPEQSIVLPRGGAHSGVIKPWHPEL